MPKIKKLPLNALQLQQHPTLTALLSGDRFTQFVLGLHLSWKRELHADASVNTGDAPPYMKEIIEGVSLYLEAQFIQTKQTGGKQILA